MHGHFFLLVVVASVINADQLGYNYQPLGHNVPIGGAGFGIGAGSGFLGDDSSIGTIPVGTSTGGAATFGSSGGFGGFAGANSVGNFGGLTSGGSFEGGSVGASAPAVATEFNKEFYTYSAPEEDFADNAAMQQAIGVLKKNLRVVFIRTPENNGVANAALQLAKQAAEERTAIFVLTKQADVGELANRLQTLKSSSASKPEVHFVKYRTPEDASRAQQVIQAQYDALNGPSQVSNEGVAPVLNFVSASGSSLPSSSSSSSSGFSATSSVPSSGGFGLNKQPYLPPTRRLK